ncbi:MAG: acyl carrier protein [Planctomycetes bacterium]|nr:acyl carrier protein [Planctomycetota bacterium]
MSQTDATLEDQLKRLIVDTLALEDVAPESIDTNAPLFGEGLGLDSIDALEIALAIHARFGVRTVANDEKNREYYHSIKSLADFVRARQGEAQASAAPA